MKKYLPAWRKEKVDKNEEKVMALFFEQSKEADATGELKLIPIKRKGSQVQKLAVKVGIKSTWVYEILERLKEKGRLSHEKRKEWIPTAIAVEKAQKSIWHIANIIQESKENEAFYWHGADTFGFKFGFSTDNIIDFTPNKTTPTSQKINTITSLTKNLQDYAFELLVENIKNKDLDVNDFKSGKTIQAIEIDWDEFRKSFKRTQNFIEDINDSDYTQEDILSDPRLNLPRLDLPRLNEESQAPRILYDLLFLAESSLRMGDAKFKMKLVTFLKVFSSGDEFYTNAKISPTILKTLIAYLEKGKDPLKDPALVKDLVVFDSTEFGYTDISSRYIIATKFSKFGDVLFMKKVDEFDNNLSELKRNEILKRMVP